MNRLGFLGFLGFFGCLGVLPGMEWAFGFFVLCLLFGLFLVPKRK